MRLLRRLQAMLLDPARELKERVFILLNSSVLVVVAVALLGDIIYSDNIVEIVLLIILMVINPLMTYIGVKTGHVDATARILSFLLITTAMPVVFLFGGGVEGAAIPWMVFSYLYIGLVLFGWWRALALLLLTAVVIGLFFVGYRYPDVIIGHQREIFYLDAVLGVIEVGMVCFVMTWFQNRLFMQENERAKAETRKVEKLNRAQNRFFSSMSHEIRTPINSILGLNEIILRQEDASEEIIRDAGNIQGAGRMLLALINDILDFSRIEAGKMDIVPVNYDVAAMISEIVNMIWLRAEQKGLEFKVEVDPSVPAELFGDEIRIKQILVNLLNNAVKYTREGLVTLHVEKEELREDQILLSFTVIDTGIGIKQDAIPYLFDAFRRMDEEKNTGIEGTGLGLSIVKQLVDLMDGRITVNSVYMQGSTFMVTLWQKVTRFDTVGDISLTNRPGGGKQDRYQACFTAPDVQILIVDDNEMNLEVEKKLLAGTEMKVDTAQNGEDALSMTQNTRYDLILMDHLMPGMDGIECMQHIRKQAGGLNNHVPILVLTANAGGENRGLYSRSGSDGYLMKPVTGKQLEEAVLGHVPESMVTWMEGREAARLQMNTGGSYSRKIPVLVATNSTCELPPAVVREHQIDVIPFSVIAEGRVYYDSVEAGTDELLRYMKSGVRLDSEAPTVEEFEAFFGQELKKAHNIIYITISSALSKEYERASAAAKAYGNVIVYDSGFASGCVGLLVLLAHRMSTQGRSTEVILEELDSLKSRLMCSFVTDGTFFERKKDLLGRGIYNITRVLDVRPFVRIKNGRFHIRGAVVGDRRNDFDRFTDYALPRLADPDLDLVLVIYVSLTEEDRKRIETRIRRRHAFRNILFLKATGVMAMHCGPDSFGIAYFTLGEQDLNLSMMLMMEDAQEDADRNFAEDDESEQEAGEVVPESTAEAGEAAPESKAETADGDGFGEWYEHIPGIDGRKGIQYNGSEEAYRMILRIFMESIDGKSRELDDYYNSEDWENYTIKVHALKSSARLIGAGKLADDAWALERAGNDGDLETIRKNHARLLSDFKGYLPILAPLFEEQPEEAEEDTGEGNGEDSVRHEQIHRVMIESAYEALREAAGRRDDAALRKTFSELEEYRFPEVEAERLARLKRAYSQKDFDGMIRQMEKIRKGDLSEHPADDGKGTA
ncbi:MAG: DegV family EDD domain-containing protein [Lachnospiraceae bacterium]|nr:DegV family EDD domain-containing protein [Lachnospiraceae bacterium]